MYVTRETLPALTGSNGITERSSRIIAADYRIAQMYRLVSPWKRINITNNTCSLFHFIVSSINHQYPEYHQECD